MESPGDSMPSSDDCKTSEDLPAVTDVPTKCNGMGDSDKRAATDVSPLSARTDAPSGGDELNDSDSAINAIDMFLAEKGSNGHEGEGDSVALVGEQEVESEASNIEGEVSRSQHSSDSSSNVAHRPDSGNSDSNATPSCGDDSSTQPPPDESGETTKDREGLEKEDLVLTDTEAETEHLAIHQKDEVDAEPVYASEAMRAFHSVVIAPVTEQHGGVEPTSPMDVEMATEASLVGVNEDSITGDTGGLGKVTGDEEDMDVTEPGSETHNEDVAKQQTEDEEMEVDEARSDLVGTDELASGVVTEAASVPADGSEDGYDDVDAGGKGDSADSRTEQTEQDTPPENESTDVSQSDPVSVETKTSALGSLEDQLLGNSSTDVDVKDATEIEGEMLNIASKVKEISDIDVALDTGGHKAGDETEEKCQETSESGNTATGSSKKDDSETVKDEVSYTQSTDEATVATEGVKVDKQTMKVDKGGVQSDVIVLDVEEQGKDPATAGSNTDSAVETPKKSTEKQPGQVKEKKELQDYVAGVADEFLGMLGMDKLDASEKAELAVGVESTTATGTSTTTEPKTATTTPTTSTGSGKATSLLPATAPKSPPKAQQECIVCNLVGKCKYNIVRNGDIKHLCDDNCFKVFRANPTKYLRTRPATAVSTHQPSFTCAFCHTGITATTKDQFTLKVGKELKRFCNAGCCDEFKKRQKLCSQCGKDVTTNADAFMAPVGSDSAFRDFCSQACLRKFEKNTKNEDADVEITGTSRVTGPRTRSKANQSKCAVCHKMGPVMHEITFGGKLNKLCSQPCFVAFRYANKLTVSKCEHCGKSCYLDGSATQSIQFEGQLRHFCTATCTMRFKANKTKMVGCAWCQARKSNFDMIERVDANNKYQLFCSLNCLSLYRVNLQATSNQSVSCDQCHKYAPAQYHLTMSDASVRNFCSYECVMAFQAQFASGTSSPSSSGGRTSQPKPQGNRAIQSQPVTNNKTTTRHSPRVASTKQAIAPAPASNDSIPVISNVVSLAPEPQTSGTTPKGKPAATTKQSNSTSTQMVTEQIIVKPPPPKQVRNKSLLCKPFVQTKATSCRPHTQSKCTQTDEEWKPRPHIIPVPVPIYVPVPMALYNYPTPYPLPIPIPIPVPCFIPTTKKSAPSILKHMKEIQERMPADPFEAELLMMAETLATAEKGSDNDSDSDDDDDVPPMTDLPVETAEPVGTDTPVAIATSAEQTTEFGEDMLQMALRMASEMPADEQALELAGSLAPSAINTSASLESGEFGTIDAEGVGLSVTRGGKRRLTRSSANSNKRSKVAPVTSEPAAVTESPDANMVLKYMFGVGEWKRWVQQKNTQVEQASEERRATRLKLFKTDILQCTADELNFSLCLFVKEVRKPDNEEYSPDSVFYMCVGIQQYLFENSRIDNIFTDIYFEKFTGCLNDLLTNYTVRLNAQGEIVCRIEEEHLWESKQLGAHSPYVLLNTLIYFNTRYFHLRSVDDHLHLSFSHIMKHWKKLNVTGSKTPGRSVYLRYYVPTTLGVDASGAKRKKEELPVFEQGENADNPLRCPVKLYEFYLSKCPESIKNRNDVFYLVPERSCVPDSPVWYSTQSLGAESMNKMLNRVRLVKEIQEVQLQEVP